ncbi:hypothetical protein GCM10011384_06580 [Psychrobacillus lasiicapitis]|nr:hypothetical protein GCM10011384_06580 [Psychrobacillus lasiicapitis]
MLQKCNDNCDITAKEKFIYDNISKNMFKINFICTIATVGEYVYNEKHELIKYLELI